MRRGRGFAGLVLLATAGCAAPPPAPGAAPRLTVLSRAASAAAPDRANNLNIVTARPAASYGSADPAAIAPPAAPPGQGDVSLHFDNTDIRTAAAQILGGILHRNFIIDPAVSGTVTLRMVSPIPRTALLPTLRALLAENGAVLVQSGGIFQVLPAAQEAASPAQGVQVIPLRHADAGKLASLLQSFMAGGGTAIAAQEQNAIIVAGDPAQRAAIGELVRALDADRLAGQSYEVFPVSFGTAKDFAAALASALGGAAPGPITVVPLARQNAVLVIAGSARLLADAGRAYAVISEEQRETVPSWHAYTMRDGVARDAAAILRQAFTPGDASAANIRIVADDQTNAIMVYATAVDNDRIDAMLREIDIAPAQVRIDATIAEVDLNAALQYGTQFFFKSGGINAVLSTGSTAALNTSFPGFVLSGIGGDAAPVAISVLQAVTKVHVLSAPELTVQDGQDASLEVGSLVPYLTQTAQATGAATAPAVNSVDYRQTGIVLRVTPHVGTVGMVTLDIAQEISAVQPDAATPGIDSPTFSERAVTARAAIGDGQTIGLAGLISDDDSRANSGLPFLKNIPLLGNLAGAQTTSRTRTELIILITPHIIRAPTGAAELTADLRDEFANPPATGE